MPPVGQGSFMWSIVYKALATLNTSWSLFVSCRQAFLIPQAAKKAQWIIHEYEQTQYVIVIVVRTHTRIITLINEETRPPKSWSNKKLECALCIMMLWEFIPSWLCIVCVYDCKYEGWFHRTTNYTCMTWILHANGDPLVSPLPLAALYGFVYVCVCVCACVCVRVCVSVCVCTGCLPPP